MNKTTEIKITETINCIGCKVSIEKENFIVKYIGIRPKNCITDPTMSGVTMGEVGNKLVIEIDLEPTIVQPTTVEEPIQIPVKANRTDFIDLEE